MHWPPTTLSESKDMRLDPEQPQLEHLEQTAGARADDGHRRGRITPLGFGGRKQVHAGAGGLQARPALASVGVWKYSLSEASWSTRRFSSAMRPSAVLMGMQSWQRGSPHGWRE